MKPIRHITLLMAMAAEAAPVIERLALIEATPLDAFLPFRRYSGKVGSLIVTLLTSGKDSRHGVDNVGLEAATLAAYVACHQLETELLLNAGTAGGFGHLGGKVGSLYLSDREFVFHDRHVPLPGFDEAGLGRYPATNARGLARALDLECGIISSGSSLSKSDADMKVINRHGAVAKEMEAAGIAWVAWLFNKPLIAIKSITNLLDYPEASQQQFQANLEVASDRLAETTAEIIRWCDGRTLQDLAD